MTEHRLFALHRAHAFRFLIASILLTWTVIGILVAAYYGAIMPSIWLFLASLFFALMAAVEFRASENYHTQYVRSLTAKFPPHFPN